MRTQLTSRGKQLRRDCLVEGRKHGIYHFGGSFSSIEILIALYDRIAGPDDRIIMSKGHGWFPQALILMEQGLRPTLFSHPQRDPQNGVWATTGSLGHGLPIGAGMAWAKKLKAESGTVYVIIGEGCLMEGTFWETLQLAGKLKLNNLCVLFDKNNIQGAGSPVEVTSHFLESVTEMGWEYTHTHYGHSVDVLEACLQKRADHRGPELFVVETVKGYGVSFMENDPSWHARWPSDAELVAALEELK